MTAATHIFALLFMCFAGLAPSDQATIPEKCKTFAENSKSALLYFNSTVKCYVSFKPTTFDSAKRYCKENVPEGLQGQLLVIENDEMGYLYGFKALTKCNNEFYWIKERFRASQNPSYQVCERACGKDENGKVVDFSKSPEEACSKNQKRKFICEYAKCKMQLGDARRLGHYEHGTQHFKCIIGNRFAIANCTNEKSWDVYWEKNGKFEDKETEGKCPFDCTKATMSTLGPALWTGFTNILGYRQFFCENKKSVGAALCYDHKKWAVSWWNSEKNTWDELSNKTCYST